ncbi:putative glucan endo-1,3-beta-glucosidase GVI [Rutidosis leptorrhynchoides]|uniref:putative glucan endo-1,3-beta-glucosidase GVI n=1 Tax=Rutidosis leptorrhynchoides TaxID=125765 RepID=UPI003A99B2FF
MASVLSFINLCVLLVHLNILVDAGGIGLNYGLLGNNLPSPPQVIELVKSRNIEKIRLFNPDHNVLEALRNSRIQVVLGTLNADIPNLANDPGFARTWVQDNIVAFATNVNFICISVGNEVQGDTLRNYVPNAIKNLDAAVKATGYKVPVTTTIGTYLLSSSYPPSTGDFVGDNKAAMQDILSYLSNNGYPILATVYPYFPYTSQPAQISISYALGNSSEVFVRDGDKQYTALLVAMTDAIYAAMEKNNGGSVEIIVCESGWPSKGNGGFTSIELAQTYNQNLVTRISNHGTPRKPGSRLEVYIFAIFNENQKPGEAEQNFGLYYPDMTEVYHIDF